jgi:hypothetical protein
MVLSKKKKKSLCTFPENISKYILIVPEKFRFKNVTAILKAFLFFTFSLLFEARARCVWGGGEGASPNLRVSD